jgi:hypothetical protein
MLYLSPIASDCFWGEPVLVTLVFGHDLVLITCLESLYLRRFMFAFRCLCLRPTYTNDKPQPRYIAVKGKCQQKTILLW